MLAFVAIAAVTGAPAGESPLQPFSLERFEAGPVDFVCDSMQLTSDPNVAVCRSNVVGRRGDIIFCCDHFEGTMSDEGGWERLVCSRNVRAQRGDEVMWSDRATFVMATNDLILTGHPRVRRGKSILLGERIVIDTKHDRAHIEQPRGRMEAAGESAAAPALPPLPLEGELPRKCPLPEAPPGHAP